MVTSPTSVPGACGKGRVTAGLGCVRGWGSVLWGQGSPGGQGNGPCRVQPLVTLLGAMMRHADVPWGRCTVATTAGSWPGNM